MNRTATVVNAAALSALIGVTMVLSARAELRSGIDPEANLPYWEVVHAAVSIRLVQRLPDQTRGFFLARGFADADAELIAQSCVFQTVFKNIATDRLRSPVTYDLRDWRIVTNGAQQGLKTREDWQSQWIERRAPPHAQVAFEWSLLPTRQTYHIGDYNWGMTTYNLSPGTEFALVVAWHEGSRSYSETIPAIRCAADDVVSPVAR